MCVCVTEESLIKCLFAKDVRRVIGNQQGIAEPLRSLEQGTLEEEDSHISELILFFAFQFLMVFPFGQTWEKARELGSLNTASQDTGLSGAAWRVVLEGQMKNIQHSH